MVLLPWGDNFGFTRAARFLVESKIHKVAKEYRREEDTFKGRHARVCISRIMSHKIFSQRQFSLQGKCWSNVYAMQSIVSFDPAKIHRLPLRSILYSVESTSPNGTFSRLSFRSSVSSLGRAERKRVRGTMNPVFGGTVPS